MSTVIRDTFNRLIPITKITPKMASDVQSWVWQFEVRGTHPEALGQALLGVHKINFHTHDKDTMYSIFGITGLDVVQAIRTMPSSAINRTRHVEGDPFNQFCIYAVYKVLSSDLPDKTKKEMAFNILLMKNYHFFTSAVWNSFYKGAPTGADQAVMQLAISSLSRQFEIVRHGTWGKVLRSRTDDILNTHLHANTLKLYTPDDKVKYVITDMSTRIKSLIKYVATVYYKMKEEEKTGIGSYKAMVEVEGELLIRENTNLVTNMSKNISTDAMNFGSFYNEKLATDILRYVGNVPNEMFKKLLIYVSDLAVEQYNTKKLEEVRRIKNANINIGIQGLFQQFFLKTYSYLARTKTNMKSPGTIIIRTKEIYTSSRIANPEINAVKDSFTWHVEKANITTREGTKASLRTALIIYLTVMSFKYMKR